MFFSASNNYLYFGFILLNYDFRIGIVEIFYIIHVFFVLGLCY